jgi:hypothetical protein
VARSNYADIPIDNENNGAVATHRLFHHSDLRAFIPTDGVSKPVYGRLAVDANGDWSWKPCRDRLLTLYDAFRTFHGVPPGGAELSHSAVGTNLCASAQNQRSAA